MLFWGVSYWVLLNIFAYDATFFKIDYLFTALFHVGLFLVVYLNLRLLIPYFWRQQAYLKYAVLSILALILCTFIQEWILNEGSKWLFPEYYFISTYTSGETLLILFVYTGLSTLLHLSKSWFDLKRTEKRLDQVEKEAIQHELDILRAQVNPHFLFNSLQSIYALILDNEVKSGEVVLQLSDVLRYALYESQKDRVPLKQELAYLKKYIALESLRTANADIQLEVKGKIEGLEIAPLLILPLVENGFKHGVKGDIDNLYLHIFIEVKEISEIYCKVSNNKGEVDHVILSEASGIGLKNLKRRLELIYPSKHEIRINEEANDFIVELKLLQ